MPEEKLKPQPGGSLRDGFYKLSNDYATRFPRKLCITIGQVDNILVNRLLAQPLCLFIPIR